MTRIRDRQFHNDDDPVARTRMLIDLQKDLRDLAGQIVRSRYKDTTFIGGSTNVRVSTGMRQPPQGVTVVKLIVKGAPETAIGAAWSLDWKNDRNDVIIKAIDGLTSGVEYALRLRLEGD